MRQQQQQQQQQQRSNTSPFIVWAFLIVASLFALFGVVIFYSNNHYSIDSNNASLENFAVESLLLNFQRGPTKTSDNLEENADGSISKLNADERSIAEKLETSVSAAIAHDNNGSSGSTGSSTMTPKKRLNVIVLYPDDMRHDSMSCAGTQSVQTPFLDYLSTTGIRFRQNCVTTSICWISRATLFTGQWHARHGATYLFRPVGPEAWNHSYPAILKQHGYYLGHIGKWQYRNTDFAKDFFHYCKLYEGFHVQRGEHVTDRNQRDAIDFLRTRPKDVNFALQVAFYAPKPVGMGDLQWTPKKSTEHLYLNETFTRPKFHNESYFRLPALHRERGSEARRRWTRRFGTPERYHNSMRAYYRMITEVDEACRNIYNEVKAQGILNETMIIFTTDNGFFHGEHGLSGKWFPYQESIRVPLIIHDPRIPDDKVGKPMDEFTLNVDLAETILGAAGLAPDPGMQGRDIAHLYLNPDGPATWRREFYYEFPSKGKSWIPEANALVRHDFKLFVYPEWNVTQLFHIQEDPLEENDLFHDPKYQDVVDEMLKQYYKLQAAVK